MTRLRVALASRAVLAIDSRAAMGPYLTQIEGQIRQRIFDKGWNAADQQMPRAKDRPTGRYRYRTGELYRSLRVIQPRAGELVMIFNYRDVVLSFLNRKYGPIFDWSPSDIAFVNRLVAAALPPGVDIRAPRAEQPRPITPRPPLVPRVGGGFNWTATRTAQVVRFEGGFYYMPDGRLISQPPMSFEVAVRFQFPRYDAIMATETGLRYKIGGDRPISATPAERPILIIFVPGLDDPQPNQFIEAR